MLEMDGRGFETVESARLGADGYLWSKQQQRSGAHSELAHQRNSITPDSFCFRAGGSNPIPAGGERIERDFDDTSRLRSTGRDLARGVGRC